MTSHYTRRLQPQNLDSSRHTIHANYDAVNKFEAIAYGALKFTSRMLLIAISVQRRHKGYRKVA